MGDNYITSLKSPEIVTHTPSSISSNPPINNLPNTMPGTIPNITPGLHHGINSNIQLNPNLLHNGNIPSGPRPQSVLKISNLPKDLTQREATIMFSLVIDDILKVELSNANESPVIFAFFKNFNTCLTTFKLLNNKFLFNTESPIAVEIDDSLKDQSTSNPGQNNQFDLNYDFNTLSIRNNSTSSTSQPQPLAGSSANNVSGITGPLVAGSNPDSRSRFLFNDPFNNELDNPNAASHISHNIHSSQWNGHSSQGNSQPQTPSTNYNFEWNQGQASQQHNQGNQPPQAQNQSQTQSQGQVSNPQPQPQQPSSGTNYDSNIDQSSIASGNLASKTNVPNRRTSSAFFQSNFSNNLLNNSFLNSNFNQPLGLNIPQSQPLSAPPIQQHVSPTSSQATQPQGNTNQSQPEQQGQQTQNQSQHQSQATSGNQAQSQSQSQPQQNQNQNYQEMTNSNVTSPVQQVSNNMIRKDVPDLSLLARVPPPANPADQNPPCNTLYVGNLPPDATEQELRNLFSPQKGFRRLSFRTKNSSNSLSNSNNHGPMCFVEFEDVAHATKALADLYGRILPRPSNANGKGGIRLSFSKNPLGVRGPQRRSSSNQVNGSYNYNYQMK